MDFPKEICHIRVHSTFSGLIGLFWLQAGHYQRPESAPPLVGLPDHEFNTLWEDDHLAHLPFHAPSGVLALPELPEEAARQSTKTAHASMVNIHANCSYEVRCIASLQSAVCIDTRGHSTSEYWPCTADKHLQSVCSVAFLARLQDLAAPCRQYTIPSTGC